IQSLPGIAGIVASPDSIMGADRDAPGARRIRQNREDVRRLGKSVAERFPGDVSVSAAVQACAPKAPWVGIAREADIDVENRHDPTPVEGRSPTTEREPRSSDRMPRYEMETTASRPLQLSAEPNAAPGSPLRGRKQTLDWLALSALSEAVFGKLASF